MEDLKVHQDKIDRDGFTILNNVYTADEVDLIIQQLEKANTLNSNFKKSADLFAIRQLFKEVPELTSLVFNDEIKAAIRGLFGEDYFLVKSIYFDKPGNSNWFVAYHQDLTISVDKKTELPGYSSWTIKNGQFAVQPSQEILEDNFTIRIHLDDTDENNGALKVIPSSHKKGVYRAESVDWSTQEITCNVPTGGVMIMKPLLMHASSRTTNDKNRRIIHLEFSRVSLPEGIEWAEKIKPLTK